jgi:hypothetical protein
MDMRYSSISTSDFGINIRLAGIYIATVSDCIYMHLDVNKMLAYMYTYACRPSLHQLTYELSIGKGTGYTSVLKRAEEDLKGTSEIFNSGVRNRKPIYHRSWEAELFDQRYQW